MQNNSSNDHELLQSTHDCVVELKTVLLGENGVTSRVSKLEETANKHSKFIWSASGIAGFLVIVVEHGLMWIFNGDKKP
jgi:hypothetical protein